MPYRHWRNDAMPLTSDKIHQPLVTWQQCFQLGTNDKTLRVSAAEMTFLL
jgi:hypothetical protein